MASEEKLISVSEDSRLVFGDFTLEAKAKQPDFEFCGDIYKVKTFKDITKLEKNERFLYESVPGTKVRGFVQTAEGVDFCVSGYTATQITLELEEKTEYEVLIDEASAGAFSTNIGGKLSLSVELGEAEKHIRIVRK